MGIMQALLSIAVAATVTGNPTSAPTVIDLNRASVEELLAFEGIGRMYAAKVVAARPYRTRSELVGRGVLPMPVYLAIKHRLFVTKAAAEAETVASRVPAGMVDLNNASISELLEVPGIGRAFASRVVAGRPYRDEFELVGRRIVPLAAFRQAIGRVAVGR